MVRLFLIGALCGGAIVALGPRAQQQPEREDPPAAERPDDSPTATEPSPESPTPSGPRRPPRHRAELDLPTRDLLLRDKDAAEDASPGEHIVLTLDQEIAVDVQDKPLRETLVDLAGKAELNLYLDEDTSDSGIPAASLAEPVTLRETRVRFESLVDRLLEPHSLGWMIRHDALWIRRKSDVANQLETRTYDVAPLLAAGHQRDELLNAISKAADPSESPSTGFGCSGGVLFVRHNQPAQRVIANVLAEMDQIAAQDDPDDRNRVAPQAGVVRGNPTMHLASFIREAAEDNPPEPVETQILDALDQPHDVDFFDKTLAACLDELHQAAGVPFQVDLATIASAGKRTCLESKPRVRLTGARLEAILGTLLEPRGLGWLIRHESLWITDAASTTKETQSKSYEIANLLEAGHDPLELAEAIQATIAPGTWSDGASGTSQAVGSLSITGDVLVVRHTQPVHWDTAQLLAELDLIVEESEKRGDSRRATLVWETYRVPLESAEALAKTLPDIVSPDSWSINSKRLSSQPAAEIRAVPGMLFIRQSRSNHNELRRLLRGS